MNATRDNKRRRRSSVTKKSPSWFFGGFSVRQLRQMSPQAFVFGFGEWASEELRFSGPGVGFFAFCLWKCPLGWGWFCLIYIQLRCLCQCTQVDCSNNVCYEGKCTTGYCTISSLYILSFQKCTYLSLVYYLLVTLNGSTFSIGKTQYNKGIFGLSHAPKREKMLLCRRLKGNELAAKAFVCVFVSVRERAGERERERMSPNVQSNLTHCSWRERERERRKIDNLYGKSGFCQFFHGQKKLLSN